MPCDYIEGTAAYKRRVEAERERELERIEAELGTGVARIVQAYDGSWTVEGTELPQGMHDSCVLAGLERRGSLEFLNAVAMAGASTVSFATIHGHSHGH